MRIFTDTEGTVTSVELVDITEEQFAVLPELLGSLPGDLGRYQGGRCVRIDLGDRPGACLDRLTGWLREQGIRHQVETSTRTAWLPHAQNVELLAGFTRAHAEREGREVELGALIARVEAEGNGRDVERLCEERAELIARAAGDLPEVLALAARLRAQVEAPERAVYRVIVDMDHDTPALIVRFPDEKARED